MDLRQLSYFVAVADSGTVTAAAESLHLSQPPLSVQIQQLEQELGCRLFERGPRRMQLTDAGQTLYERARGILDLCSSAKKEMEDLRTGTAGTLRLGVVSSLCGAPLAGWLEAFCSGNCRLRLELYEANTYQLLEKVRSGQIELAFIRTPFPAEGLHCATLGSEPLCAVGQPDFFPGVPGEPLPLEALNGPPLLLYRRWEQILAQLFQAEGLHPRIFCVSDSARTTFSLAEAGLGVGIVPRSALPLRTTAVSRPIDRTGLHSEICVVCRRDTYVSSAAKRLFRSVQEYGKASDLPSP